MALIDDLKEEANSLNTAIVIFFIKLMDLRFVPFVKIRLIAIIDSRD